MLWRVSIAFIPVILKKPSEYGANIAKKKRVSPLGIALPLLNSQDSLRVLCKGSHNF